eukprot:gene16461-22682_t
MGATLKKTPLSSVLIITIQVTSPDDLGGVIVEALMPAGLEPVDPNIASGNPSTCAMGDLGISYSRYYWWWWWPVCPSQETRPNVVTFEYHRLLAGTSTIKFQAVAATVGTFVLPPIKAYAVQQPEVMGATAGGSFEVCPNAEECGNNLLLPTLAVSCPGNCGGANGSCRLDTGECTCQPAFTGPDCLKLVEE